MLANYSKNLNKPTTHRGKVARRQRTRVERKEGIDLVILFSY